MLRNMLGLLHRKRRPFLASFAVLFLTFLLLLAPSPALGDQPQPVEKQTATEPQQKEFKWFEIEYELDAYYTWMDLIVALTNKPVPRIGEKSELEIYTTLLSRSAVLPQFLVLETSINPLPYFGTYVKSHWKRFYQDAQLWDNFNWIKALTAGFDEPFAFSILAGNVVNFDIPGSKDTKGLGYSGYLVSHGIFHIQNNRLIQDDWWEFEWKIKGDRKSPIKKLNWSFRIGAKEHGNKNIADVLYVSVRRSRVDYKPEGSFLLNNSGFEYTYFMDRRTFSAVQHYFTVDKKWPLERWKIALALGLGFVWESSKKYTGTLSTGRDNFQFIIRPNIEF
jgi:hypothetical protein